MIETAFDDLYQTKKEATRQEKIPAVSLLHQVPKQVADTAQAVGVSEKFLANGIPSGVLGPSQIAHDRYLSFMDALQDSFWATILIMMLPLMEINAITAPLLGIVLLYWTFHVYWWEKSRSWYIKTSTVRYINATYRIYWVTFMIFGLGLAVALDYFVISTAIEHAVVDILNVILGVAGKAEQAFAAVFPQVQSFDKNASYHIELIENIYQSRLLVVTGVFFLYTLILKVYFSRRNRSERNQNIESTGSELEYIGETAMSELTRRQQ
jgi:hypothetical protein